VIHEPAIAFLNNLDIQPSRPTGSMRVSFTGSVMATPDYSLRLILRGSSRLATEGAKWCELLGEAMLSVDTAAQDVASFWADHELRATESQLSPPGRYLVHHGDHLLQAQYVERPAAPYQVAGLGPPAVTHFRWVSRALARRCGVRTKYSYLHPCCGWVPGTHLMGDVALHLDLFEQPGRERIFQHPAARL
jgi:hypothetical protein